MSRYLIGRLAAALPVLLVVSLLAFGLEALTPGDAASLLLQASGETFPTKEEIAAKRAELHLDDPLPVRYLTWLGRALRGDFGHSFRTYEPVGEMYRSRLPATLLLAAAATLLSALIAVPLGVLAAYHRGGVLDRIAQVVAVIGAAVPGFWLAFIFILIFAVQLHWLPAFGSVSLRGMILPTVVVALPNVAVLTRLTRAAILDVLGQDFVTVARAKGLATSSVARHHILPNVLVPVLTVIGLDIAHLMTGAAIVESIFGWPGIGKLAVDAALVRDIPVLVGFSLAAGLVFVISNLIVDLAAAAFDPRVRSV